MMREAETMGRGAYRDADEALGGRRKALLEARRRELKALVHTARRAYAARVARRIFGIAGIAGMIATTGVALLERGHGASVALLLTWGLALTAWLVARIAAHVSLGRSLAHAFRETGDVKADVDRLEALTPLGLVREKADRLERGSVTLWLVAVSLMVPYMLHLIVAAGPIVSSNNIDLVEFDEWMRAGILQTFPCSLALVWMSIRFGKNLRHRTLKEILEVPKNDGWEAYGVVVAASAAWAIVSAIVRVLAFHAPYDTLPLAVVPVVLVSMTALCYVAPSFGIVKSAVRRERLAIGIDLTIRWPRR
jgi:hypothetical protein